MKTLVTICLVFAFFTFVNQSSDTVVMNLWWSDHGMKKFPAWACFATAEIKAGQEHSVGSNYPGTKFACTVSGYYSKLFETWRGDQKIRCVWDGELIQVIEDEI